MPNNAGINRVAELVRQARQKALADAANIAEISRVTPATVAAAKAAQDAADAQIVADAAIAAAMKVVIAVDPLVSLAEVSSVYVGAAINEFYSEVSSREQTLNEQLDTAAAAQGAVDISAAEAATDARHAVDDQYDADISAAQAAVDSQAAMDAQVAADAQAIQAAEDAVTAWAVQVSADAIAAQAAVDAQVAADAQSVAYAAAAQVVLDAQAATNALSIITTFRDAISSYVTELNSDNMDAYTTAGFNLYRLYHNSNDEVLRQAALAVLNAGVIAIDS